jgi:DnaJ like chaperone protein
MVPPPSIADVPEQRHRMSIWGKIVGGAAGFALGGPIGALIGAAAGHAVDRLQGTQEGPLSRADGAAPEGGRAAAKEIAFTIAVIVLGAKMAKADGRVSRAEVDAFKEVFHVPPHERRNVGRLFDRARRDAHGFEPYARQIARMFHRRSPVLEELLDGLFHIAKADGRVDAQELDYLGRVGEIFGFSAADFDRIRTAHLGPDEADPYVILGVTRGDDNAAIKAAWRKLVRENHPDRLMAKGLPKEFIDLANEKLGTINAAYDRIARERGIV